MRMKPIQRLISAWFRDRAQFKRPMTKRDCPMCGYHGYFISVGNPSRFDARCAQCGCRERHRLTWLWVTEGGGNKLEGKRIIHFAPEAIWMKMMKDNPLYETADLYQKGVDHQEDMTQLSFEDESFDVVMANHVLEHIDEDDKAISELYRILKKDGFALITVPINAGRNETYRNPEITDRKLRMLHFAGGDHRRYYGLDFKDILSKHGFKVETYRLPPEQEVGYGLLRDEWIYIARV
ncbi:MAG: methyltransferase domain-containing protein [Rhizobiaceae bacterium]